MADYKETLTSATWMVLEGITTGTPLRTTVDAALQFAIREHQTEPAAKDAGFNAGICVALQVMFSAAAGDAWVELIRSAGPEKIAYYAAHVEPDEWLLTGLNAWGYLVDITRKPRKKKATS